MMYRMTLSLAAVLAAVACSANDATDPTSRLAASDVSAAESRSDGSSRRSGELHITKECSKYLGGAGEQCTLLSSSLKQIPAGSTVTYRRAAADGLLDTDVVLDPPGPGNNVAFGHCKLSLVTYVGVCTFSGGTGKFRHFRARVDVSPLKLPDFAWEGRYSFGK